MATTRTAYLIISRVYQGGGILSRHRTLAGAQKALARHDRTIRHLDRRNGGGGVYHDARICTADGTTLDLSAE